MQMKIERDGERRYQSETDISEMARSCEEIISSLSDYNTVPGTALLNSDLIRSYHGVEGRSRGNRICPWKSISSTSLSSVGT
jgi:hypothetical protein